MKLFRLALIAIAVLVLFPNSATFGQNQTPAQVVTSFYRYHFAHNHSFTKRNVLLRQQWLSPKLNELLLNEFRGEREYANSHRGESFVPYMDGDPFTNSQEYPTSFRVGQSAVEGEIAKVDLAFVWKGVSEQRDMEIRLVRVKGRWLIDNIVNKKDNDDLVKDLSREKYLH